MRKLTLLIPGLLGPFDGMTESEIPRFPALELLLAKAGQKRSPPDAFYSCLCRLFGLEQENGRDLPIAAITRLIDDDKRPQGFWMRADPVHLSAGMNSAVLVETSAFPLTQREAILLGAELNDIFHDRGWEFEVPVAGRWYINLEHAPGILTREITQVMGQDVRAYMPVGSERSAWDKLLNEIQMILHDCEVNLERRQRDEPAVNSLWFWGGGELPDILHRSWSILYSDNPVAAGLAMLSGTPCRELPDRYHDLDDMNRCGNGLLVLTSLLSPAHYQDFYSWRDLLTGYEQDWFMPLLNSLRQGGLEQLVIITETDSYTINRRSFYKFWQPRRSLIKYIEAFKI